MQKHKNFKLLMELLEGRHYKEVLSEHNDKINCFISFEILELKMGLTV